MKISRKQKWHLRILTLLVLNFVLSFPLAIILWSPVTIILSLLSIVVVGQLLLIFGNIERLERPFESWLEYFKALV